MHEFVQAKAPDPLDTLTGVPSLHQTVVFCVVAERRSFENLANKSKACSPSQ